jgi:hypothetical protein
MDKTLLLGRWDIVSWEQRYDDGRITHPLGTDLEGFILYGEDGNMVCMMGRADRPRFVTGGQWNASDAEKSAAYSGFMAYAGRFSVDGEWVTHHVGLTLFPNWQHGDQRRHVRLRSEAGVSMLDIVARLEEQTTEARSAVLTWRRRREPA